MSDTDVRTINHACGHTEDRDLSDRPEGKRDGFAEWLAKRDCIDCWREERGLGPRLSRDEWIAQQRAKEAAAAEQWAADNGIPELVGTEGQVAFANRVRYTAMLGLYAWAVEEENSDPETFAVVEEIARTVDLASWWLDHRKDIEGSPETLLELLQTAGTDGIACENAP